MRTIVFAFSLYLLDNSRIPFVESHHFLSTLASHRRIELTHAIMNNNNMNNNPAGKEDYLDKALDKVEQMAGKKVRAKMSPT